MEQVGSVARDALELLIHAQKADDRGVQVTALGYPDNGPR